MLYGSPPPPYTLSPEMDPALYNSSNIIVGSTINGGPSIIGGSSVIHSSSISLRKGVIIILFLYQRKGRAKIKFFLFKIWPKCFWGKLYLEPFFPIEFFFSLIEMEILSNASLIISSSVGCADKKKRVEFAEPLTTELNEDNGPVITEITDDTDLASEGLETEEPEIKEAVKVTLEDCNDEAVTNKSKETINESIPDVESSKPDTESPKPDAESSKPEPKPPVFPRVPEPQTEDPDPSKSLLKVFFKSKILLGRKLFSENFYRVNFRL